MKKLVLFFVGFCVYITMEVIYKSESHWLMGLCGGIAILVLDSLNNYISWDLDILAQCGIGSILVTFMEFCIGNLSKLGLLPIMWDYTNVPLNYNGIICLPFSILWMVLSFVGILVADSINYYVFHEEPKPYYRIFGKKFLEFR